MTSRGEGMTYKQAMIYLMQLCDGFGYVKSDQDLQLKIPWRVKTMPDGTTLTLWFKAQSIYYTRNNQAVRHFKDARSLHLPDIKSLAAQSRITPLIVMNKIEGLTS